MGEVTDFTEDIITTLKASNSEYKEENKRLEEEVSRLKVENMLLTSDHEIFVRVIDHLLEE